MCTHFKKIFGISATIFPFTLSSTCETLLLSTHQHSVHYSPFNILFATHLLYRFSLKSIPFSLLLYTLFHRMLGSMQPYSALSKRMYRTFLHFSYITCSFNSGLTSHIMSEKSPSNFNNNFFFGHIGMWLCPWDIKNHCIPELLWVYRY